MFRVAAVIGSGVMGASIAAYLANAGVNKVYLYDIIPNDLTEDEIKKGITKESKAFRNRFSNNGKAQLFKSKLKPLFTKKTGDKIFPVNLEDDLEKLEKVDFIVEAVVENIIVKQQLFSKIAKYTKPSTIFATNTSGLSIDEISKELGEEEKERFLGVHFFNPPRKMKLVEIVPGIKTSAAVVEEVINFAEDVLGKEVVIAKNTPAFIANRIGGNNISFAYDALNEGYSVEEIDAVTGKLMGRPVGSLSLTDIIGLDILSHDSQNTPEKYPWYFEMINNKQLGNKTKCGFYKREKNNNGSEIFVFDLESKEYRPAENIKLTTESSEFEAKILEVIKSDNKLGKLAWSLLKKYLVFSAVVAEEIANDVRSIDMAMKLGYNFKVGPFELWDKLGVKYLADRINQDGENIPKLVQSLIESDKPFFYDGDKYYSFKSKTYESQVVREGRIDLQKIKEQGGLIEETPAGSIINVGNNILCLELHGAHSSIVDGTAELILKAVKTLEESYSGMVITSAGKNFCTGANLSKFISCYEKGDFSEIEADVILFQKAMMAMKYCMKPIVAAPAGKALGGGAEICLHAHKICAHAELNIGLVECGVGLIPSGGGTKELLLRQIEHIPEYYHGDKADYTKKAFDTIFNSVISDNALDAVEKGYLRKTDVCIMNENMLLTHACTQVLRMIEDKFVGMNTPTIEVTGVHGKAVLNKAVFEMFKGNFISEYDRTIGNVLARVISCGELPKNSIVNETYMLKEELKSFLKLVAEPKTQERINSILTTGRRLKN